MKGADQNPCTSEGLRVIGFLMSMASCNLLWGLVGASRFELETSCAQGRRATRLRYAPTEEEGDILAHFTRSRQ